MKKNITCLIWLNEVEAYANVPYSTIRKLRSKGVVVRQDKARLLQAIGRDVVLFFDIQKKSEVAA